MEGIKLDGLEGLGDELQHVEGDPEGLLGGLDPKVMLWEAGELPTPEDVAFSLQQLCAGQGEGLEIVERLAVNSERIATAAERIAASLEILTKHAAAAAKALG